MKAVSIDIVSASQAQLLDECVRLGINVTPGASQPVLRAALRKYRDVTYRLYHSWVRWTELLDIPNLEITDDTTLQAVMNGVCDYLYNRLVAEGYVDSAGKGRSLTPVISGGDGDTFYVTGRPAKEWVTIVSPHPDSSDRCALSYAAACAFPEVRYAYWTIEEEETGNG